MFWLILCSTKKLIFYTNFVLIFFLENTYKFCYEKKIRKIAVNFFVKYFV